MKIVASLDDKDLDAIAARVAKALGGKPPKPAKAAASADDGDGEGEGEGGEAADDFEAGEGEGEGGDEGEGEEAPDRDAVRAALSKVSKKFDQDTAMALMKKHGGGASALSKLAEDKFAAVIKACEAKAKK